MVKSTIRIVFAPSGWTCSFCGAAIPSGAGCAKAGRRIVCLAHTATLVDVVLHPCRPCTELLRNSPWCSVMKQVVDTEFCVKQRGRPPRAAESKFKEKTDWQDDKPTPRQIRAITKLCRILGIKEVIEEQVRNKREARNAQYELRAQIRRR